MLILLQLKLKCLFIAIEVENVYIDIVLKTNVNEINNYVIYCAIIVIGDFGPDSSPKGERLFTLSPIQSIFIMKIITFIPCKCRRNENTHRFSIL